MTTLETRNQPLPYYLVKGEKVTMPLSERPQAVTQAQVSSQIDNLNRVYRAFRLLQQQSTCTDILKGFPLSTDKSPDLPLDLVPPPSNVIVRVDTVNGKTVDINNKPAGLGLILSAYQLWLNREAFGDTTPLLPQVDFILPDRFNSAVVLTNRCYPFMSDQEALVEIMQKQTDKPWSLQFPESSQPKAKEDEAALSFSYLDGNTTALRKWRKYLCQNPDRFIENPAAAIFWDNKALMAIPFMDLDLPNPLRSALEDLRRVFPPTYLFKSTGRDKIYMAISITSQGVEFEEVTKENIPLLGKTYLKPLGDSGGRNISVRKFDDWGSTMTGLERYTSYYPEGFIIQQTSEPEIVDGMRIKDGYFISSYGEQVKFVALERMGTTEDTPKIHGGSRTKLVPVSLGV